MENVFKKPSERDPSTSKSGASQKSESRRTGGAAGEKWKSALDEIMEHEERTKEKMNRRDHWLHEDIVVKVITKKLGDKYYKKKAFVKVYLS